MKRTTLMNCMTLALALALVSACSKSGKDESKSSTDEVKKTTDEAPDSKKGAKRASTADTKVNASTEAESESCAGVCKSCYDAVVAGCEQCPDDRDCDAAEDPCMTAKMLGKQFGCAACAGSLGRESATDDCNDD